MKRLPNYSLLWVSFIVFLCTGCNPVSQLSVSSPDGNLCLHVETENGKSIMNSHEMESPYSISHASGLS